MKAAEAERNDAVFRRLEAVKAKVGDSLAMKQRGVVSTDATSQSCDRELTNMVKE